MRIAILKKEHSWIALAFMSLLPLAHAEDLPVYELNIRESHFNPVTLEIPAGRKIQLKIKNEGPGAEEFESTDLNREKVIPVGKTVTINLGPLSAGTYRFFGDFHRDVAQGQILVK